MEIIKEYVKEHKSALKKLINNLDKPLKLTIVQVNDDPASNAYVKGKLNDSIEVGVDVNLIKLPETTTQDELLELIDKLNHDKSITGLLVQMPLPKQIDEHKIKLAVSPLKDVDGFNPLSSVFPCTPQGIVSYLKYNGYNFKGKNAVIIGRSSIVGKPLLYMLLNEDCTPVIMHSKTPLKDQKRYLENADLIIVAVGKPNYLTHEFKLKEDAVVFDVGINRVDGHLVGDCEPDLNVKFQSPVPGGVGLLTRMTIFENLLKLM